MGQQQQLFQQHMAQQPSGGQPIGPRELREQLEHLHALHQEQVGRMSMCHLHVHPICRCRMYLSQVGRMCAEFEARLSEARAGGLGERASALRLRASELAATAPAPGPLGALLQAVHELDSELGAHTYTCVFYLVKYGLIHLHMHAHIYPWQAPRSPTGCAPRAVCSCSS